MKTQLLFSGFILSISLLSGCASIVNGTAQKINIETPNVSGAQCYLQNDKGRWYLPCTPGCVTVKRSYRDLIITTQKPGYPQIVTRIKSKTKGMVFGNALFGGCVGAAVDCCDGAAYDYPDTVVIPMKTINY